MPHGALVISVDPYRRFSSQALAVLDAMPIPLVIFTVDGVATFCNVAAERMWGWPCGQLIGRLNVLTNQQSVANRSHEVFARTLRG